MANSSPNRAHADDLHFRQNKRSKLAHNFSPQHGLIQSSSQSNEQQPFKLEMHHSAEPSEAAAKPNLVLAASVNAHAGSPGVHTDRAAANSLRDLPQSAPPRVAPSSPAGPSPPALLRAIANSPGGPPSPATFRADDNSPVGPPPSPPRRLLPQSTFQSLSHMSFDTAHASEQNLFSFFTALPGETVSHGAAGSTTNDGAEKQPMHRALSLTSGEPIRSPNDLLARLKNQVPGHLARGNSANSDFTAFTGDLVNTAEAQVADTEAIQHWGCFSFPTATGNEPSSSGHHRRAVADSPARVDDAWLENQLQQTAARPNF